jgi:hypothetical protein
MRWAAGTTSTTSLPLRAYSPPLLIHHADHDDST